MKLIFFIFLLILGHFCANGNDGRIAGGEIARLGQFPWHVHMYTNGFFPNLMCGGALINPSWVLTAGMCLIQIDYATLYFGMNNRLSSDFSYILQVRDKNHFITHPGYDAWNPEMPFDDNIALIYLKDFDKILPTLVNVAIIPLPSDYVSENFVGDDAIAVGFGATEDPQIEFSQYLKFVSMPVITNEICNEAYNGTINEGKICTDTTGGRSTCFGDFGAPLVTSRGDRYILIGVGSLLYLNGCTLDQPAAFTRVTSYLDWINEHVIDPPIDSDRDCICDCICYTCDEQPPRDEL